MFSLIPKEYSGRDLDILIALSGDYLCFELFVYHCFCLVTELRPVHCCGTMASLSEKYGPDFSSEESRDIANSLEMAHAEIAKLKKYLDAKFESEATLEKRVLALEREIIELRQYATELEDYILQLDTTSRKRNLVITGLTENKGESTDFLSLKIFNFFHPYVATLETTDIDCAYRLGKKSGKSRPVICKFVCEKTRNEVYAIRSELNDDNASPKVYLNEDLPQLVNNRKADFRTIMKLAKSKKIPASYQGNKLTVNNVTYSHRNLDCLPAGVRLEDAKTVKVKGGFAFHSAHSWLSNFFPCSFDLQGITFRSAEHAFQYTRAIRLGEPQNAELILRSKSAVDAKRLGKGITHTTPEWDSDKIDVMRLIITEKFSQNFELGAKLVSTGQSLLIEATMDGYWGAKASITSKSIMNGTWMGANFLGKILTETRDDLRRNPAFGRFLNAPSVDQTADQTPSHAMETQSTATSAALASATVGNSQDQQIQTQSDPSLFDRSSVLPDRQSLNQSQVHVQNRKNKNRPLSSSSSLEDSMSNQHSNFKKKARIYSPQSSLPPVRSIADLFRCPSSTSEDLDITCV